MANLYEILANAQNGHAIDHLAEQYGLTHDQTEAAVSALLPAISKGLKQSTATPEGLGNLLAVMGQQQYLPTMYDDPKTAFGQQGRTAGNDVLATMFGSPDVSRAFADQAQHFSGVGSGILKKMLPVIAGLVIGGLMKGSGKAAPTGQANPAGGGGGLGDILGQIFGQQMSGSPGTQPPTGQPAPLPGSQPTQAPTGGGGQVAPGGDLLTQILREVERGIREGHIKPVVIGPGGVQFPQPGGQGGQAPANPSAQPQQPQQPQVPGGDILGQILRDLLGGGGGMAPAPQPGQPRTQSPGTKELSDLSKQLPLAGGYGAALFGEQFEPGRDVDKRHLDNIDHVFTQFFGGQQR